MQLRTTLDGKFFALKFPRTGANLRKPRRFAGSGMQKFFHQGICNIAQDDQIDDGNDKKFELDMLHDNYRWESPISDRIKMTSTLYTMMTKKDSSFRLKPDQDDYDMEIVDEEFESNYVRNILNVSMEGDLIDHSPKKTTGAKAVADYYMHHKLLDKAIDQNRNIGVDRSVFTGMLEKSAKSFLLPNKCGIIKSNGPKKNLNLRNAMLGNKYISIVSEGIKRIDYDMVDLRNNRLNEKGAGKVLKNLRITNKHLDLSRNRIGKSVGFLKPVLLHKDSRLQKLNLSKNELGDTACNDL
jgi:hypothetical protein